MKPRKSCPAPIETQREEVDPLQLSSDEGTEAETHREENNNETKEKNRRSEEPTTSKSEQTPSRLSQRTKKRPNWYGQNVMVQKVDEGEKGQSDTERSETKTEEELRRELEAIPNFLEMTPEEIHNWIHE